MTDKTLREALGKMKYSKYPSPDWCILRVVTKECTQKTKEECQSCIWTEGGKQMTQQTNGMPELKYSEETFKVMYEALMAAQNETGDWRRMIDLALEKVEGK